MMISFLYSESAMLDGAYRGWRTAVQAVDVEGTYGGE